MYVMNVLLEIIFYWSVMLGSTDFHGFRNAKEAAHIVLTETTKAVQSDLLSDPANQLPPPPL